eukprot:6509552-Lingulodinium_polyedra.AAC.1
MMWPRRPKPNGGPRDRPTPNWRPTVPPWPRKPQHAGGATIRNVISYAARDAQQLPSQHEN